MNNACRLAVILTVAVLPACARDTPSTSPPITVVSA